MSHELKTLELAKIYESQEYYEDAFKIYSFLDAEESSAEILAGLNRTKEGMEVKGQGSLPQENISRLFEKWLRLMILKQRFDKFKKIKLRLV